MRADIAAIVAALGVVLLIAPVPVLNPWVRRLLGLALIAGAWIALAVGVVPDAVRESLSERAATPLGAIALVLATLIGVGLVGGLAHVLDRRPLIWFVLLALALPFRVPIALGDGETARLLVPLYPSSSSAWRSFSGAWRAAGSESRPIPASGWGPRRRRSSPGRWRAPRGARMPRRAP